MTNLNIVHIAPCKNLFCNYDVVENCHQFDAETLLQNHFGEFATADIIIIDENYDLKARSEGIKLLKMIRLYYIHTHCVIYSFLPKDYFLYNDKNKSILLSEGVTFERMPLMIDDAFLQPLIDKKSPNDEDKNLAEFFTWDYYQALMKNRHFHANWWGPLRIMEYLKLANGLRDDDLVFSDEKAQMYQQSLLGRVVRYIKTLNEGSVWDEWKKSLQKNKQSLESDNIALSQIQTSINQLHHPGALSDVVEKTQSIQEHNRVIVEREQEQLGEYQPVEPKLIMELEIENLRKELKKKNPKILYLDDMAGCGWDYVLQMLFYGEQSKKQFKVWPYFSLIERDSDYDTIAQESIMPEINNGKYNLVILDLRLKNEQGRIEPKQLSGIKLLEALRKASVRCPILIISASDKADIVEQAFISGADAYWRKEGVDENNNPDPNERVAYTCNSIFQLLKTINFLCEKEFKYYYNTIQYWHDQIRDAKDKFWWEQIDSLLPGTKMKAITRDVVLHSIEETEHTLMDSLIKSVRGNTETIPFLPCITSTFNILYQIHPNQTTGIQDIIKRHWFFDNCPTPKFITSILDAISIRNQAIHRKRNVPLAFYRFKKYFDALMDYLTADVTQYCRSISSLVNNSATASTESSTSENLANSKENEAMEEDEKPFTAKSIGERSQMTEETLTDDDKETEDAQNDFTGTIDTYIDRKNKERKYIKSDWDWYYNSKNIKDLNPFEKGTRVKFNLTAESNYCIEDVFKDDEEEHQGYFKAEITSVEKNQFLLKLHFLAYPKVWSSVINFNPDRQHSTKIVSFLPFFKVNENGTKMQADFSSLPNRKVLVWEGSVSSSRAQKLFIRDYCLTRELTCTCLNIIDLSAGDVIWFHLMDGVSLKAINIQKDSPET